MTMTKKEMILTAPDTHLDPKLKPLVENWKDEPTSLQILEVLDQCIHGGEATDFVVKLLQVFLDMALKAEGQVLEDILPKATWRDTPPVAKLTSAQKHFIELMLRSPNQGDGWREVASGLEPILMKQVAENPELFEVNETNGVTRVRLTERGNIVADYL